MHTETSPPPTIHVDDPDALERARQTHELAELAGRLAIAEQRIQRLQQLLRKTVDMLEERVIWQIGNRHDAVAARRLRLAVIGGALELPDDETLLFALERAGGEQVAAGEVAQIVFHGAHFHTDTVRVGQQLSRLAREGRIVKHPATGHRQSRYSERTEVAS